MNTNLYNMAEGKTRATRFFLQSRSEPNWEVKNLASRQLQQEENDSKTQWSQEKKNARYETIVANISKNLAEARQKYRSDMFNAWNHYNAGRLNEALECARAPLKGGM